MYFLLYRSSIMSSSYLQSSHTFNAFHSFLYCCTVLLLFHPAFTLVNRLTKYLASLLHSLPVKLKFSHFITVQPFSSLRTVERAGARWRPPEHHAHALTALLSVT